MTLSEKFVTSSEEQRALLQGKRILIAEDEAITQLQLKRLLTTAGLVVVGQASNGQEAVDLALASLPELVLMDINMPLMDGIEATRRILQAHTSCVVMLTAYDTEEHRQQAKEAGALGFVIKPVSRELLLPQLAAGLKTCRNT